MLKYLIYWKWLDESISWALGRCVVNPWTPSCPRNGEQSGETTEDQQGFLQVTLCKQKKKLQTTEKLKRIFWIVILPVWVISYLVTGGNISKIECSQMAHVFEKLSIGILVLARKSIWNYKKKTPLNWTLL
jgi:hypothetical protein